MKADTRILIKNLFETYELFFKCPSNEFKVMGCTGCNTVAKYDEKTELFEKLKHKPDCPVTIMRNRIRTIINEDKVVED